MREEKARSLKIVADWWRKTFFIRSRTHRGNAGLLERRLLLDEVSEPGVLVGRHLARQERVEAWNGLVTENRIEKLTSAPFPLFTYQEMAIGLN